MKSTKSPSASTVQGEGDYRSAEKHNQSAHEPAESGKVGKTAGDAAPGSPAKGTTASTGRKPAQPKPAQEAPGNDPLDKPVPEKLSRSQAKQKS